eukprot:s670_g17.t1
MTSLCTTDQKLADANSEDANAEWCRTDGVNGYTKYKEWTCPATPAQSCCWERKQPMGRISITTFLQSLGDQAFHSLHASPLGRGPLGPSSVSLQELRRVLDGNDERLCFCLLALGELVLQERAGILEHPAEPESPDAPAICKLLLAFPKLLGADSLKPTELLVLNAATLPRPSFSGGSLRSLHGALDQAGGTIMRAWKNTSLDQILIKKNCFRNVGCSAMALGRAKVTVCEVSLTEGRQGTTRCAQIRRHWTQSL